MIALWMLGAALFVFSAVCGVCGARGLGVALLILAALFGAAVAYYVIPAAPL